MAIHNMTFKLLPTFILSIGELSPTAIEFVEPDDSYTHFHTASCLELTGAKVEGNI